MDRQAGGSEGEYSELMPTRCPRVENEYLTAEFWPEGLNAQPIAARVISLAPGVLCLATEEPPAPGARFVAKFSVRGDAVRRLVDGECLSVDALQRFVGEVLGIEQPVQQHRVTLLHVAGFRQREGAPQVAGIAIQANVSRFRGAQSIGIQRTIRVI